MVFFSNTILLHKKMLLLLFENPDTYKIPLGNFSCELADLFDIQLGLIEDRYKKQTKDGKSVYILNYKSFQNNDSTKAPLFITRYDQYNILDFQKLIKAGISDSKKYEDNDLLKPVIPEKKLLTINDYLITIRGQPKGYSMFRSYNSKKFNADFPNIVATNHFVRLRPKVLLEMHIPYLHLILDSIVENQLRNLFEQKRLNLPAEKKYSVMNSFNIDELKSIPINLTKTATEQIETTSLFEKNYENYFKATMLFNEFKQQLNKSFTSLH